MILNSLTKYLQNHLTTMTAQKLWTNHKKRTFLYYEKKPVCNFRWENEGSLSLELTSSCLKGGGWWCMTCHHQEWKVWVCKRRDTACIKHSLPENHFQPQLSMSYKHWIVNECLSLVDQSKTKLELNLWVSIKWHVS